MLVITQSLVPRFTATRAMNSNFVSRITSVVFIVEAWSHQNHRMRVFSQNLAQRLQLIGNYANFVSNATSIKIRT